MGLKNTATVSFNGFNGSDFGYCGHHPRPWNTNSFTRHLGRVLLCLALRFGQFIRYIGWLEIPCLFCQSFEIPFSFYCALLRKCRNSWQYIYIRCVIFWGMNKIKGARGNKETEKNRQRGTWTGARSYRVCQKQHQTDKLDKD